ncbi:hypothetical protein PSTT_16699, partial [Puccinia striiformis]
MKVVVVPIEKEAVLSVLIGIAVDPSQQLAAHQTIVFLATKHHLKYIGGLLIGALDQIARCEQLQAFCLGQTNILVHRPTRKRYQYPDPRERNQL